MIPLETRVEIVDDVGKENSALIGQQGKVIGYKWNKFREEKNLPLVQLNNGKIVSGWSLWYSPLSTKLSTHGEDKK
jgi:hypothetical protein